MKFIRCMILVHNLKYRIKYNCHVGECTEHEKELSEPPPTFYSGHEAIEAGWEKKLDDWTCPECSRG